MVLVGGKWLRLRHLVILLVVTFLCGMLLGVYLISSTEDSTRAPKAQQQSRQNYAELKEFRERFQLIQNGKYNLSDQLHQMHAPSQDKGPKQTKGTPELALQPNYDVHTFYYPWYGTPDHDGQYYHWNHEYLQHWDAKEAGRWPKGRHTPPDDIGSNFYPALGAYSSSDPQVIEQHMKQIRSAGIGVLAVSWYPSNMTDDAGKPDMSDHHISMLLDHAQNYSLKICIHVEPYKGRDHITLRKNLQYIHDKYSSHPAYYKRLHGTKLLPLFYIYDSYLVSPSDWAMIFQKDGALTVRQTDLDGLFIGLLVEQKHISQLIEVSGFDGFYTYFASEGFTFGSRYSNWQSFVAYSQSHNALFIPSIGPGYIDERVRPWNARNTKSRELGGYYEQSWRAAVRVNPPIISITSFNEWHEGTQIEKAVPKSIPNFTYLDYSPQTDDYYLSMTRTWVSKYKKHKTINKKSSKS